MKLPLSLFSGRMQPLVGCSLWSDAASGRMQPLVGCSLWSDAASGRMQPLVLCSILALGLLWSALPSQSQAQTQGFWVWNGKTMVRVYANDSSQYKVIEWQMWLYDQGKPTGGTDYWGLLRGSSSQELMQKLKREQDTELSTNNYFGRGRVPSQTMTGVHPIGATVS